MELEAGCGESAFRGIPGLKVETRAPGGGAGSGSCGIPPMRKNAAHGWGTWHVAGSGSCGIPPMRKNAAHGWGTRLLAGNQRFVVSQVSRSRPGHPGWCGKWELWYPTHAQKCRAWMGHSIVRGESAFRGIPGLKVETWAPGGGAGSGSCGIPPMRKNAAHGWGTGMLREVGVVVSTHAQNAAHGWGTRGGAFSKDGFHSHLTESW